eukprot:2320108-Alexandrium_andersonii.AAC.1
MQDSADLGSPRWLALSAGGWIRLEAPTPADVCRAAAQSCIAHVQAVTSCRKPLCALFAVQQGPRRALLC